MYSALSPEGKSFAYDARASGFGRGEGGGCLILKPLADAIACGDPVRAVIRSSACNHSGRTQGITMPSQMAQQRLLARLHESVGLDPGDTAFVEVRRRPPDQIGLGLLQLLIPDRATARGRKRAIPSTPERSRR